MGALSSARVALRYPSTGTTLNLYPQKRMGLLLTPIEARPRDKSINHINTTSTNSYV